MGYLVAAAYLVPAEAQTHVLHNQLLPLLLQAFLLLDLLWLYLQLRHSCLMAEPG